MLKASSSSKEASVSASSSFFKHFFLSPTRACLLFLAVLVTLKKEVAALAVFVVAVVRLFFCLFVAVVSLFHYTGTARCLVTAALFLPYQFSAKA